MPFQPVTRGVEVVLDYSGADGEVAVNVFNIETLNPPDNAACEEIGDNVAAWWDLEMQPVVPSHWTLNNIKVKSLETDPAPYAVTAVNLPGTNASPSLPGNVTIAVSLRTGLTGRSYRGRIYHIGISENMVVGSRMDGVTLASLRTIYLALAASLASIDAQLCILSRTTGGVLRSSGVLTPVTDILFTNDQIDHMDSRLPRGH